MDENNVELNETEEEEAEVLTCPVCGEEVDQGTENCPLCGAPVGALENSNISGTSIDNSAAIDAMLQSAAMLVEESASLGVSLDDDEEDVDEGDEDDDPEEEEDGEEEEETAADPMEPVNITAMPSSDLTDEQKSKIEAGGMINLNAGAPDPAPPPKKAPKKKKKKEAEPTLYNMDEKGNPLPEQETEEEAPYTAPSPKPAKPKKKGKSASPVLVILTAIVSLALGCAVGFFVKLMFFPDIALPECQEFADRAVLGVNSVMKEDIYIAEAYVSEGGDAVQCVFRAFVDGANADSRWFRVKVYNDAPDTVRIYFQLDMEQYQAMMNSGDDEQRIQASMLMNNQNELDRCISEIQNGTGGWQTANASMLNDTLHPMPEESADNA